MSAFITRHRRVIATTASAIGLVIGFEARPARSEIPTTRAKTSESSLVRGSPVGLSLIRALGPQATSILAPATGMIGALVEIPPGARAEELGLDTVAPGIGRIRGSVALIESFATAHPDLKLEVAPPLQPLMDRAGIAVLAARARETRFADGHGVMIGVADTGLDVTHPEMRDTDGRSRVAWMLDLSLNPGGEHPELEQKFGIKDDSGKLIAGRVFSKSDIDDLLLRIEHHACKEKKSKLCAPADEIGHGTHVTGIAASSGANGGKYPGIAPAADIVFVRVSGSNGGIENDNLVRAVDFMFDRATAEKRPMVVNVSLGSDFGPHDGSFLWEQALAAHVGPDHPGRVIVAAAGNSGSIADTPVHQGVFVNPGTRMRVPITTAGAEAGSVQVWITLRRGADMRVGLEGPEGELIPLVERGHENGMKSGEDFSAGIVHGGELPKSPIPDGSHGAIVVWQGRWGEGTFNITLEGVGMADLYLQSTGDASTAGSKPARFTHGVREGTINLPATHPSIIGVGCTVNRASWSSIGGVSMQLKVPVLDREGGLPLKDATTPQASSPTHRQLVDGEVCWFSSAGPTAAGVPKPEIAAPGALVVSALSRNAQPGSTGSVFTRRDCPDADGGTDNRCLQVDDTHGIAIGTSMSSPVVAGVVALLLQADPTLTQDKVLALLQAGAHRFRQSAPFEDQAGPGEVDALASLDALDQMKDPTFHLPALEQSWITLSADYVAADGSTPMTAIVELRTADGSHRGDFFDAARLKPVLLVEGKPVDPAPQMIRRGPGVWFFVWNPPPGLGGLRATFGATFDSDPIVSPRTVPIATDHWSAVYASKAHGSSCSSVANGAGSLAGPAVLAGAVFGLWGWRRGRRRAM